MGRRRSSDYFSMGDAARLGHVVRIHCGGCSRSTYFLAEDLAKVFGEHIFALEPPFPCSRCSNNQWLRATTFMPKPGDYGHLSIRRPGPVRVIQTWHTEKLGRLVDTYRPGGIEDDIESKI